MAAETRELAVFAWLPERDDPGFRPAGLLNLTQTRGALLSDAALASEFRYGLRYLERPQSFEIDPVSLSLRDRVRVRGVRLFPVNGLPEFGGIRDAAPDAWGRRVIEARRKVPANSLTEAEYLLDASSDRVGALDVRANLDAPATSAASDLRSLGYLLQAAAAVEAGEPVPAALADLLAAGQTAGGARPKASVRDDRGVLWLAKFPARGDTFDVARAEYCTLELARRAGLTVPELQVLDVSGRPVMLIRRFDRFWAGAREARLPFVSGLTLVACSEFESRMKRYADLALAIREHVAAPCVRADVEELFARMVFNIFVSNDDDHLRNHGFLRDPRMGGWRLSPLYDVVPRPGHAHERYLHLEVGDQGKLATLDNALTHYPAFLGKRPRAIELMHRVWSTVRGWKSIFEELGAPGGLIDRIAPAIRDLDDIASPGLRAEIRRTAPLAVHTNW
jgi:serine/threonine-protein kinase HipA